MLIKEDFTKREIFQSGAIYSGSILLNRIVAVINTFVIIYFLTVYEYGVFRLILSLVGIFQSFVISGLDGVVRNDIAINLKNKDQNRASQIFFEFAFLKLFLSLIMWILLYLFIIYFSSDRYEENLILILKIASVTILLNYLSDVFSLFFKSTGSLSLMSKLNTFLELVKLPVLLLAFYWWGANVLILFVSIIITQSLTLFVYWFACYRLLIDWWKRFCLKWPVEIIGIARTYGKWSVLTNIFSDLMSNARNYVIKFLISTEAVAIYNIAKSMIDSLYQLVPSNKVFTIFLPFKINKGDLKEKYYHLGIKYATWLYIFLMFIGGIIGTLVIKLFFVKYESSLEIFYVMLPVFLFFGVSDLVNSYLFVLRKQKIIFYGTLFKNILSVTLIFTLVPIFGIKGLGLEFIISNIVLTCVLYFTLKKMYPSLNVVISDFFISLSEYKYIIFNFKSFLKQCFISSDDK